MITRINSSYTQKSNSVQKPTIKPMPKIKTPQINPDKIMQHYSSLGNITFNAMPINFKGLDFKQTISNNYFQLPKIKNSTSEIVQAMPDKTQLASAESIFNGDNTVCIAPTGTGKTAIANYAITKNLENGKRTYYTTPLKALSNDKYREFCKIYGEENVGLLTGDIKLKKDAPVLIMTTEIFRNMALSNYANSSKNSFQDVATVVFDEAHYINEEDRGRIWEESIMLAPKGIQILPLTATIGNAKEFSNWIEEITGKKTNLVEASPKDRHVPLVYYNYAQKKQVKFQELINGKVDMAKIISLKNEGNLSERQTRAIEKLQEASSYSEDFLFEKLSTLTKKQPVNHSEFADIIRKEFGLKELPAQEITQLLLDSDTRKINKLQPQKTLLDKDDYNKLIQDLQKQQKLPAIIFKFSRAGCNQSAKDAANANLNLTNEDEQLQIKEVVKKYQDAGIYLGKNFNTKQLEMGIASHNAGLMPGYKKLIEDLFSRKLLKVVFATSTLSAGINMPAKTVVITQLEHPSKVKGESIPLSANEFHQMSGRAGRRGVDTIGNVVLHNLSNEDHELAEKLVLQKADPIKSKYEPSYNLLTSYYQKNGSEELLNEFIEKTLKTYQSAENKDEIVANMKDDFENHKKVLLDLGFLDKAENGYRSNIKGKMLSKVHGYNELTLVEMIKNKKLENLDAVELASFASSMVATNISFEDKEIDLIRDLIITQCEERSKDDILEAICDSDDYDEETELTQTKNGIFKPTQKTDLFSSYIGYRWAQASENEEDSIEAFKNILADPNKEKGEKDFKNFNYHPFKDINEGSLYNTLTQSIDVLKQIINICEFAIETPELECDKEYYANLMKTAEKSVELVKIPPIYDKLSVA